MTDDRRLGLPKRQRSSTTYQHWLDSDRLDDGPGSVPMDSEPVALFGGVSYDYASLVQAGSLIFTAGACPLDVDGNVVAPDDHAAQSNAAMDNLLAVLSRYGATAGHLVRMTIYVVGDRTALEKAWATVAGRLAPHRPPSTLLGVAVLGYENQLVEIDGIAAVPWTNKG